MLTILLWLVGSLIAANLLLRILTFLVFALTLNRRDFHDPVTAQQAGLQPLIDFPGVRAELPEAYRPQVQGAHAQLRKHLGILGEVMAVMSVAAAYLILVACSVRTWLPYWCLLAFPFNSFSQIGARGLRIGFRLFGPVQAVFMQLFYSSFTSCSMLAIALILGLRAMGILP